MKVRHAVLALAVALAVVILAAGAADAGNGRIERRITLAPTAAGNGIDSSGHARVRKEGRRQDFKVSIDARVPNGTVFRVFVTNDRVDGDPFLAGRIVIAGGDGELELSNENGRALSPGVAPVLGIRTVTVKDAAGQTVLQGSF